MYVLLCMFFIPFVYFFTDISKLVPLSFVADVVDFENFDPEASGLLLHEYFDKVYKMYPNIKSYKTLQEEEILHFDPLKDQLNPYSRENYNLGNFKAYLASMINDDNRDDDAKRKGEQKKDKFQLDVAEVKEYIRPTVPPLSAVNEPKGDGETDNDNDKEEEDGEDEDDDDIPDFIKNL